MISGSFEAFRKDCPVGVATEHRKKVNGLKEVRENGQRWLVSFFITLNPSFS